MNPEPFESFMNRCLHHPQHGYYARNIRSIGSHHGDFTTAPQLSDLPAKAIASWVTLAFKQFKTHNLIELGPGLGTLSQQVLRLLPTFTRIRTKLHLVESSPKLASLQKQKLGSSATIHTDIRTALQACHGNAIIFSNELVDAFPVRVFQLTQNQWLELFLDHSAPNLITEKLLPPASLPHSTAFSKNFPEGQHIEVHESYQSWLTSWLPLWKSGQILTIDYGNTIETLYHRRPHGTLRAYLMHQLLTGHQIYQNQGLQDITADINFSDLTTWSAPHLSHEKLITLSEFIKPFSSHADPHLTEACDNFLCLIQSKHP